MRGAAAFARLAAILVVCLVLAAPRVAAAERPVDLLLVLAVDASGSVDARRFELQRRGYAEAFANPRVLRAIRAGPLQAIAVTMFQWTGPSLQARILDWTVIADAADADRVASAIALTPRQLFGGGTSLSGAIDYALRLFPNSPFAGERRVIDVSGDGANNVGRPAAPARDAAVAAGIVINGLPILNDKPSFGGFGGYGGYGPDPNLDKYYQESVVGGPGSFMIPAENFQSFDQAILSKLIREISANPSSQKFADAQRGK